MSGQGYNPLSYDQLTEAELERIYYTEPHVGERFWIKNELHTITSINDKGRVTLHPLWD